MRTTNAGLALFAGQVHGALEVCVASFREMTEAIMANDTAKTQSAAERIVRQADEAAVAAKVIERLAREMRTAVRRVA